MTDQTEAEAVAKIAYLAAGASEAVPGTLLTTVATNGQIIVKDTIEYAARPRRKTGIVAAHDAPAFIAYMTKHALPETEVWADLGLQQLVAVINTHRGITTETPDPAGPNVEGAAGWGDHRLELALHKTPAWKAWEKFDRQFLAQTTFAEHIEERLPDFALPSGAEMLELAQSFKASTKVKFESSKRLASGETTLEYREVTEAKAGPKGDIAIPDIFTLGLSPFDGCDTFKVNARLRYRISDGSLSLGYVLERPEDVLRLAFDDIVTAVDGGINATIWHGTP